MKCYKCAAFILCMLSLIQCNRTSTIKASSEAQKATTYFGQPAPGLIPQTFAPTIISRSDRHEFGCSMSRDKTQLFFGVDNQGTMEIHHCTYMDGEWSAQEKLFADTIYNYNDPMLSLDETRLYFISNVPPDEDPTKTDIDICYVEKKEVGWSSIQRLNTSINNSLDQYYSSFTNKGELYFASKDTSASAPRYAFDIYKSNWADGDFEKPVKLSERINTPRYEADVFVAPDESYLIFCSIRREGLGKGDLYISFKDDEGRWTEAQNMGSVINSEEHELCPYVTPDGKYLFYTSNQDIYWVDIEILERYRPN